MVRHYQLICYKKIMMKIFKLKFSEYMQNISRSKMGKTFGYLNGVCKCLRSMSCLLYQIDYFLLLHTCHQQQKNQFRPNQSVIIVSSQGCSLFNLSFPLSLGLAIIPKKVTCTIKQKFCVLLYPKGFKNNHLSQQGNQFCIPTKRLK